MRPRTAKPSPSTRRINRGRGHSYLLDGEPVMGVTTVLNEGIPKPGLIGWAFDTASKYAVDHWEELAALGAGSRLAKIQKARYADRDAAGVRGTAVHALAQRLAAGEEVDVPEPYIGHVDSYLAFVDDWRPRELLVEAAVFARPTPEEGRPRGYAGTLDLIADLADGHRWLLDWKTAASGVFAENALQLAAYRYADFYLDDAGAELELPRVTRTGVVWLRGDGYDLIPVDAGPDALVAFGYAQELAAWRADPREMWVGDALQPPALEEDAA